MKLLYLSCHAILEYDELRLFEKLGIDYFSLGSYINPRNPVDPIRPALTHKVDEWLLSHAPDRDHLTAEFLDRFDVIVVMHKKEWITNNWELLKDRNVIWRTIGQSTPSYEDALFEQRFQGRLKVVRYSRREANIDRNIGSDAVIPFYKDPEEFKGYNGFEREVIIFHQDLKNRNDFVGYQQVMQAFHDFPAKVYGPNNQNLGELNGGFLSYDQMRQKMRDSRVYFYTGTQPASYTLNLIEAMMTGIPVVAIGPKLWNTLNLAGDVYELPDIIQNTVNGFISDDMEEIRQYITFLLGNRDAAKRIGEAGRETAIERWGMKNVAAAWSEFFQKQGLLI
jgi:hypothetical protein